MEAPVADLVVPMARPDVALTVASFPVKPTYTVEKVTWTKRDALLFNASIGCKSDELHFLYVCADSHLHRLTMLIVTRNDIRDLQCFQHFHLG